jgi:hypothetical protein
MRISCWTTWASNSHSEYVTLIAFPLQQWLCERASVLRYAYIACRLTDNIEKYGTCTPAIDGNIIQRMRISCRTTWAANSHSEYVTLIAFPLQQWLCERASMLRYAYIACLVGLKVTFQTSLVCMLDNLGCKLTLRICNTYCFSTATLVMRTRLNVTLRVHRVSCGSESNVSKFATDSTILYIGVKISQDSRWVIHHEGSEGISLITWILHLVLCYASSLEVTWSKCHKSLSLALHCDTLGWVHTCNVTAYRATSGCTSKPALAVTVSSLWCDDQIPKAHRTSS